MAEIEVENLRKVFDTVYGKEVAVDGVSLSIFDNEFLTLVGPSGCGKTTCLRCVAGLETPTSGSILLNGRDITDIPPNKRNIAMMFQSIALYPHMTVRENISYPLKVKKVPKDERDEPTERVAAMMQIEDMLDKYPGDLSGGQRQRAALARTVVQKPDAFLMDEPLSDLDAKLKVEIRKEIQRIHKKVEKPIIYVTHDQEEAMTMSDRIAVMNEGRIEQIGPPVEIYRYPENMFVGQFIGNHGMNMIRGEVVDFGDTSATVRLDGNEVDVEFEELLGPRPTGPVCLGFRPENTYTDAAPNNEIINGDVALFETFGEQGIATIESSQGPVYAIANSNSPLREGSTASISFNRERAHLFDLDSGNVVAHTS